MAATKSIRANRSVKHFLSSNDFASDKAGFSVCLKDKIVAGASAAFEGIGLAGIVSAALWYTTAPTAPDGFKGPISTFSIASAALASLIVAIPIGFLSYKKLLHELQKFYDELLIECQALEQHREEIIYDLLKLRSIFNSDQEFKTAVKASNQMHYKIIDRIVIQSVCDIYNIFKSKRFTITWQATHSITVLIQASNTVSDGKLFSQLIKENHLSHNPIFRKALVQYIYKITGKKNIFSHLSYEKMLLLQQKNKRLLKEKENIVYGLAAGVTCSEVLLSIGWTIFSILIGLEILTPISDFAWWIFAIVCILTGVSFGFGIGLNKQQQKNNALIKEEVRTQNFNYIKVCAAIKNSYTKKVLEEEKFQARLKPKISLVKKLK